MPAVPGPQAARADRGLENRENRRLAGGAKGIRTLGILDSHVPYYCVNSASYVPFLPGLTALFRLDFAARRSGTVVGTPGRTSSRRPALDRPGLQVVAAPGKFGRRKEEAQHALTTHQDRFHSQITLPANRGQHRSTPENHRLAAAQRARRFDPAATKGSCRRTL